MAALDPSRHISQYGHTAWRVQDGAVDLADEITQTADGYLWLGSSNGLLRFDGVKFTRYAPPGLNLPTRDFTGLLGARDGSLWIGMNHGLLRLKDGILQSLTGPNDRSGISSMLEDDDGTIWITRYRVPPDQGPLCRVEGNGLHCFGKADGIPVKFGLGLIKDKSGNIWFGSSVLCRWRPGSASTYLDYLQKRQGNVHVLDVVVGPSGEIVATINEIGPDVGIRQFSGGKWTPYIIPGFDGTKVLGSGFLVDRSRSLWIATENQGLYRVHDGTADHYGSSDGLSGDTVTAIYEDHEGNIWVSTDGGVDMFRDTAVLTYSSRQGLSELPASILALRDGSVWLGGRGAVDILERGRHTVLPVKVLGGSHIVALFQDHRGTVWLGGEGGKLLTYQHGRFDIALTADAIFIAIGEDTNENIWALTEHDGLFRIKNRLSEQVMSGNSRWSGLLPDPAGGVWTAARNGDLTHFGGGNVHTVALNRHESPPVVQGIIADTEHSVLEFTTKGIFRWDNRGWEVLDSRNGLPCDVVYSAIKDSSGDLWLYSQCGLLEIEQPEVQKWYQGGDNKVSVETFDKFDGAQPRGIPYPSQPVTTKTSDGRLWFLNIASIQTIDPKQIYKNSTPPPVYIETIVADRKDFAFEKGLRLPALSRDVEIDYTAMSFAEPQKVRFRYELEGRDRGWQDPGTRRQAFYTDLPPGKYRFRVVACNNSGVWNEAGASLDFSIAPAWYQTNWFRVASAATFLLLLWFVYQLRLRQLRHQFSIGLEARVNERTRIARDLHDTLLQSFHGLLLRLQTASNLLPTRPDDAKRKLDGAIDQASQAIAEGRDAVQSLRSSTVVTNDLAVAIRTLGEELAGAGSIEKAPVFEVAVEGDPKELRPIVRDEVYRIAGEALRNAFRHAQATRIEVDIRYSSHDLRLRIRDNGKGIDPQLLGNQGRVGHFGLHGMRERAKLMGGNVELWSNVGSGTEIELTIPAAKAYETHAARLSSWLPGKDA